MFGFVARYKRWLHSQWPAGTVEKLPDVREDGTTNVPGVYVVGDLTGVPLLKFSADSGARVIQRIAGELASEQGAQRAGDALDVVILGAGVSGMAAALEAQKLGLAFEVLEASEPFSTIVNFPARKPIYTYPTEMTPAGELQVSAQIKEELVDELRAQTLAKGIAPRRARAESVRRSGGLLHVALAGESEPLAARRVVVAIGRSGNFRKLGVPGEELDKVSNRLHDPKDFADKDVLVVGGGDSALETAIAIAQCGARVTLSYRKPELSRPKPANVERLEALERDPLADVAIEHPTSERVTTASGIFLREHRKAGSVRRMMASHLKEVRAGSVVVTNADGEDEELPNDAVFAMIGREAPLDFFRRSNVHVRGEIRPRSWIALAAILLACVFVYHWKKPGVEVPIGDVFQQRGWFPYNVPDWWASLGERFDDPSTLLGTLKVTVGQPGFYYSLAYCLAVVVFGVRRVRRRRTPYVKRQTIVLAAIQVVPLFLLPYLVLPWLGYNGAFDDGALGWVADQLFPKADYDYGREYWRAFGLILAWPLFIWNVFTEQPLWGWLVISLVQTFVVIPLIVFRWGKGGYCGWICSCGALAETMGDAHRHKMPHGPFWNRFNMLGQAFLLFAFVLLALRIYAWAAPGSWAASGFSFLMKDVPFLNYVWFVDLLWAGIFGVAFYWHFSGRVWCRFACPLAALMHVYARFSQFRILAEKKKCISCNVCTSVCHQGIDVMNFANKGLPMEDPECVRCSACVQSCPTGVLEFGRVDRKSGAEIGRDRLPASPVRERERERELASTAPAARFGPAGPARKREPAAAATDSVGSRPAPPPAAP